MVCGGWCLGALVLLLALLAALAFYFGDVAKTPDAPSYTDGRPLELAAPAPSPLQASTQGGAPYHGAHEMSDLFREYENVFKPQSLSQTMPTLWRQKEGAARPALEPQYAEFASFLVTPESFYSAQAAEAGMRHPQSTRNGHARTLGATDLVREKLAPLTIPLDGQPMPFLDSQARQDYVAEALGGYV